MATLAEARAAMEPSHPGQSPGFIDKDMELYALLMELHGLCGWIIILCLIAHIGGALKHRLVNKDGVLARMSLF